MLHLLLHPAGQPWSFSSSDGPVPWLLLSSVWTWSLVRCVAALQLPPRPTPSTLLHTVEPNPLSTPARLPMCVIQPRQAIVRDERCMEIGHITKIPALVLLACQCRLRNRGQAAGGILPGVVNRPGRMLHAW
mmetsp:Transcript_3841/g.24326  ORF Transcript_3841/g.24326 Transcript_3841/m.24326 type:complete len:132 (+) Transcript_3841:3262-3657(+)